MRALKELNGKDVLSNDGRLMGKVEDFTYNLDYEVEKIVVKMNKDVLDELGEDKPILSSVQMGIPLDQIKAFTDNVILYKPIDDLHVHFHDISEDDLLSSIRGMEISGSNGRDVGKVTDILIDVEGWKSLSLLVKLKKEILQTLDVEGSLLSKTKLAVSIEHVDGISDRVMLDTSAEEMGDIIEKNPVKKV